MRKKGIISFVFLFIIIVGVHAAEGAEETCVSCHQKLSPGQVADWAAGKHSKEGVTCSTCHGDKHQGEDDVDTAVLPDETVCKGCHETQFEQFTRGKHNYGWKSLNALPVTPLEPDELIEGGKGCGGCHNMGIKSEAEKKELRAQGYRYQNNSCDECHTRHGFFLKEARDPKACRQCHMGYDHPQYEMWESSKHGTRYHMQEKDKIPEEAGAPSCQYCHMPDGDHENHTAWGFLGVRLPLPENEQWAADRVTILKALGVLNPETGEPTARLDAVKKLKLARLTQERWEALREEMISRCKHCHSEQYARNQLSMGDSIMQKADRLMAEAIDIVASLYKDGLIQKPENYPFAYPDLLFFMRTGGSYIDQVLCEMYMKHRMRTYQAFFHINPDYAYWYGWEMMVKDLGEIKELAKTIRATAKAKE